MLDQAKQSWHEFKESEPGHRFQDRYERRRRSERSKFDLRKILNLVIGVALIFAGIFLIAAPGPGWLTVFLGLGFIGSEFLPVARALDWAEIKGRAIAEWAQDAWERSPLVVKVLIVVLALAIAAALAYGVYSIIFSSSG